MKKNRGSSLYALTLVILTLVGSLPSAAHTLRIGGAGAALGTMRQLTSAYHGHHSHDRQFVLPSLGSDGGIQAIASGRLDIGLVARPMNQAEAHLGLRQLHYARTPIVFVVAKELPEYSITTEQIKNFFLGTERHWPSGARCRPVLRPGNDSETRAIIRQVPALGRPINRLLKVPGIQITPTAQINTRVVAATPGGLGYTTMALLLSERPSLKALDFNGVAPSLEQLEAGRYPLWSDLYMVVRADASEAVERFVEFVGSETGANILRKHGNLPLFGRQRD